MSLVRHLLMLSVVVVVVPVADVVVADVVADVDVDGVVDVAVDTGIVVVDGVVAWFALMVGASGRELCLEV